LPLLDLHHDHGHPPEIAGVYPGTPPPPPSRFIDVRHAYGQPLVTVVHCVPVLQGNGGGKIAMKRTDGTAYLLIKSYNSPKF